MGGLICVEHCCCLWVAPLEKKYGKGWKGFNNSLSMSEYMRS